MSIDRGLHPFELAISAGWQMADWQDTHVLLAVSGGTDSVAMLRAVNSLKSQAAGRGQLFVGHLNHGMRGADADADQAWLAALCARLGVRFEAGAADVAGLAAEQGDGWEAAARTARYDFLCQTAERVGARWVATGHTRDDQVETIVHRLVRGTGLTGLMGMPRTRPLSPTVTLVRPMLSVRRSDVLRYLGALGQESRTDATNTDVRFTRSRLRHKLLPLLRAEFNADFDDAIMGLAEHASESQRVIETLSEDLAARSVRVEADTIRIDCRLLVGQPALIIREVCRAAWREANWGQQAMGFDQWQQLASLAIGGENQPQINLPGNIHAGRAAEMLLLWRTLC
jgi:tRNA(Ile)-lysidine synthase